MRRRGALVLITLVAVGALLWPAVDPSPSDDLPLSNYPMFARPRARVSAFPFAVLRDGTGDERRLSAREIGATDQPMQAAMTIRQAIDTGTAPELCAEIAAALTQAGTVEVVTAAYDAVTWFEGRTAPVQRTVHAACRSDAAPVP